jgi:hypothetical protein
MLHEAPTPNVGVQVPPDREKGWGEPPPKVNAPPAKATLPVLVTVRVRALLLVPTAQLPKANEFGVTVAVRTGAKPVPLSATGEPATATLARMVSVSLYDCAAVGANVTLMVQVPPAAKVVPQLPPPAVGRANTDDEKLRRMPVAPAVPVLCRVRVLVALVVPTATLPKFSGPPVTLSIATGAWEPISTAPGSKYVSVPGSGLELPKKSSLGTRLKSGSEVGIESITSDPGVNE